MDSGLYGKLLSGGGWSLPYLIRLWGGGRELLFVNDVRPVAWKGRVYAASNFSFSPSDDGDSVLEIEAVDNAVISLVDSNDALQAEFVGVLLEDGQVRELRGWRKKYGSAKWNGKAATLTFSSDDRLSMTFPSLVFNGDNNRGNA